MATLELTSPAAINTIDPAERQKIVARIDQLRAGIAPITAEITVLIKRLGVLEAEKQQAVTDQSVPLDELTSDPSYADGAFTPSALDDERMRNYEKTGDRIPEQERLIHLLDKKIHLLTCVTEDSIRHNEATIARWEKDIGELWFWQTDMKKAIQENIAYIAFTVSQQKDALPNSYEKLQQACAELETAQQTLQRMQRDASYDPAVLHTQPAKELLRRDQQAVLVSMDYDTVTLRIPRSPDEVGFSRVVTLKCPDPDAFIELIGKHIMVKEADTGNEHELEDAARYSVNFTDQLIPFPLEVVEVDGREECRLPHSVWNKYGM